MLWCKKFWKLEKRILQFEMDIRKNLNFVQNIEEIDMKIICERLIECSNISENLFQIKYLTEHKFNSYIFATEAIVIIKNIDSSLQFWVIKNAILHFNDQDLEWIKISSNILALDNIRGISWEVYPNDSKRHQEWAKFLNDFDLINEPKILINIKSQNISLSKLYTFILDNSYFFKIK